MHVSLPMCLCVLLNSTVSWVVSHASSIAYDRMPANVLAPLCDNGAALQARTSSSSSSSSSELYSGVAHAHIHSDRRIGSAQQRRRRQRQRVQACCALRATWRHPRWSVIHPWVGLDIGKRARCAVLLGPTPRIASPFRCVIWRLLKMERPKCNFGLDGGLPWKTKR